MRSLMIMALTLLSCVLSLPFVSHASEHMQDTTILPIALQLPSVKNFVNSNSHDLRSVGVSGLWSCGGIGYPSCQGAAGQPNGYITLTFAFFDLSQSPENLCYVSVDLPGTADAQDRVQLTGELIVDELNSTKGCSK